MTKPPQHLAQNTGFLLSWVAASAATSYENALAGLGFCAHHVGILEIVSRQQPIVQSRIGEQLNIFKPIIVTLVNELEAKSLVERRPHPTDKRAVQLHLLPKGNQALAEIHHISQQTLAEFLSPLSLDEQQIFQNHLQKLSTSGQ